MASRREGAISIRRLAQQLGRDYKSVHSDTSLLILTSLTARTVENGVRIGWDRIVTEPHGGMIGFLEFLE